MSSDFSILSDNDDLPTGWELANGDNLYNLIRGVTYKREDAIQIETLGYIAILRAGNLQNGEVVFDDLVYVPEKLVRSTQIINQDDLVVAMSSGSASIVGKVASLREINRKMAFGAFCGLIRPIDKEVSRWLKFFFQTSNYRNHVSYIAAGVNINNLRPEHLLGLRIPLPPLNEQRRIVEKVEALMVRSRKAKEALDAIPKLIEQFRQSVLAAAFRGDLTADWREQNYDIAANTLLISETENDAQIELPTSWRWASIGDVIESLKYGTSQKCDYEIDGVPVLRIPNIGDGIVDHGDMKYSELPAKEIESLALQPNDLLIIRSNGSVSLVGKSAIVQKTEKGFAYAGYLIRLRLNQLLIDAQYLNYCLSSSHLRRQIELPARSTSGVHNINSQEVKKLQIPLPPIQEQKEIASILLSKLRLAKSLDINLTEILQDFSNLNQSILSKAFRGELVEQDPNDEPASVLLERIQKERAKEKTIGKGKNKKEKTVNVEIPNLFS